MKKINIFFRNKKAGYSIEKVTRTYLDALSNDFDVSIEHLPSCRASIFGVLKNLIFVFNKRKNYTINHITGDVHYSLISLIGTKCILTIHDIDSYGMNGIRNKIKKILIEFLWLRVPLRIANRVVCISKETKKDVLQYTRRNDIIVIHNAIDPIFQPKEVQDSSNNRILVIGTNPNKNLENTIKALKGIDCELRIIGKLNMDQKKLLSELNIHYSNKFNLTDEEVVREYEDAAIVSFCSLYEGFGMPIIESNAVGRPVVCSDTPVLREVASDSAFFVNPNDVDEMHNAYSLLLVDTELRNNLISKGFENVRRFNVATIARQWEAVYNSL